MINVTLYTRKDCQLCDETKADLEALQTQYPHRLVEIDIDSDPALLAAHGEAIPVMEVGPYVLKAPIHDQMLIDQGYQERVYTVLVLLFQLNLKTLLKGNLQC